MTLKTLNSKVGFAFSRGGSGMKDFFANNKKQSSLMLLKYSGRGRSSPYRKTTMLNLQTAKFIFPDALHLI